MICIYDGSVGGFLADTDIFRWHIRGLVKNGGEKELAEEVLRIAKDIVAMVGVRLRREVPSVESVVGVERLIHDVKGGDIQKE